ncbi:MULTISPECIES: MBL fold metallo-hydrolase [unclassified Solwaraspora]|uniref:MBL fold metallo-hydrolase n=1 Tax=unclassified Solwaraspora TaxID=2627926 RepID=UPI00248AB900|nr:MULTISPECIES: MBL fold metallo-hydrolase [unclassified Solwaraspora]WBB97314.1 MBL fold metallo-hydrolase [Solwaraspora sp. WMMA2059]WBC18784.1 MBL fold metallo-hydrolase [Solwaraspora sp. WMMA2080]WJK33810.1 MBL fold metallo-hydrolase [Solwaraspora sp. WMMA2065]
MTAHVTTPAAALASDLPGWATLVRAPNPGPMTLDGTNTWVLRRPGERYGVLVDPGPADAGHLDRLAQHGPYSMILVTHGHPDHVEAVPAAAERFQAPVRGLTADHQVQQPDRLGDGTVLDAAGLTVTVLATPGHTADSACFLVAGPDGRQAVLTGDTILGRGTTVVAWPDGDLGDYLTSLRRLAAYDEVTALPGHGPALADCAAAARFYLAHRQARLDQVRQVVARGVTAPAAVVAEVYATVDRALWPAAEWSVRAQLAYLRGPTDSAAGDRESTPGRTGLERQ